MDNRNKNTFLKIGNYKCECGREFTNSQSYNGHLSHCKIHRELHNKLLKRSGFHTIYKDYKCKCGKVFKTNASYVGHTAHCKDYLGEEQYLKNKKIHQEALLKINGTIVGEKWHELHDKGLIKQSNTRKEKYKSGEIKPALGVGRGKYSYIIYNNKKTMLRSIYEFIFALWLFYNNKPINVEQIRVPASIPNKYANTFISDFNVDNNVYEIKGIASGKDIYIKDSFEKAGYFFQILYLKDILNIKNQLIDKGINVDDYLHKIVNGHNSKNYYVLDLDNIKK